MRELLTSAHLPKPKFHYSPLIKAGPFYFTAGMVALDPLTEKLVSGGPEKETETILTNLLRFLPDFALSLADLVSARIYTSQFERFPDINRAWERFFPAGLTPPTRSSLGVAALPLGASVEMEFVLYKN